MVCVCVCLTCKCELLEEAVAQEEGLQGTEGG